MSPITPACISRHAHTIFDSPKPKALRTGLWAQINLPPFNVTAAPMPSRPVTPTPSPNAAPLAAAASIPVQLPPASPATGGDSAALSAAASIPVQLPAPAAEEGPMDPLPDRPAVAAHGSSDERSIRASGRSRHASGRGRPMGPFTRPPHQPSRRSRMALELGPGVEP
jgi:hypothetical protein